MKEAFLHNISLIPESKQVISKNLIEIGEENNTETVIRNRTAGKKV